MLFRDEVGELQCLHDQCPHRLAPLSDGRLTSDPETGEKRVECSYHGWQFSGCGRCTLLPQLDGDKPILPLYDASSYAVTEKQGIVYVFLGDKKDASSVPVPAVPELDEDGWIYEQDYMRDLPYDYTTLVENIIDPSHVPVSHHGTVQGDRSLAQPLETNLKRAPSVLHGDEGAATPPLPLAFSGETEVPLHASSRLSFTQQTVKQSVTFTAPSLLSYKFSVAADACAPIPSPPSEASHASWCGAAATLRPAGRCGASTWWRSTSRTTSSLTRTWRSCVAKRRDSRRCARTVGAARGAPAAAAPAT